MKKQEYTGTTLTLTSDYLGSVQYLNGTAQFAATGEGRVYNNSGTYRYDYFMKDQVGNIRMTYTSTGGTAEVLQRDDYYPMGNTFNSYLLSGAKNTYLFNGMEYQENGVGTYDFHARMYDPQIGRSFQPDPMADRFASKSPYSFLANNPVMFVDPTGMIEMPVLGPDLEEYKGGSLIGGSKYSRNLRGAGGFYAAFNPRGQWVAENERYERSRVVSIVERYKDWYFYSSYTGLRFTETKLESRDWEFNTQGGGNDWASNWQNGLGAVDISWGAKEELINYAAKTAPELRQMNYVKSLKVVSKGLFIAQAGVSLYQAGNAFYDQDSNKWGVAGKAGLDIFMGAVGLWGGPVGWIISGTYFIADAAGAFDNWGKPKDAKK